MAIKIIDMSKIRQILRFFTQGKSIVFISRQTGASRKTVKRYIRKFLQEKLTFEDISGMQDTDPELLFVPSRPPDLGKRYDELQRFLPDLEKRFKQRGVTIELLLRQYRLDYPEGYGHTQFHDYFNSFIGRARPVMHMDHKATIRCISTLRLKS